MIPSPEKPATPANENRQPAIVTIRRRGKRYADVPDMTPEEHKAAWRRSTCCSEMKRAIADKRR